MSTINYTEAVNLGAGTVQVEWSNLSESDTGQVYHCGGMRVLSVHVFGTFNGGSLVIGGSNEVTPSDFQELYSISGATFYDPSLDEKTQFSSDVRPVVSGGSSNSVSVAILFAQ